MKDRDSALQELIDYHQLRDLAMRYARAIDRRDGELLRELYWDDATDQHGTVFEGSADAFVAAQPGLMDGFAVTAHYIMNTLYRVNGDRVNGDRAEGELYFVAYHRTIEESPKEIIVGGRYLDRYERRDGQWKILHRRLIWDHFSSAPAAAADLAALCQLGAQGSGRSDASGEFLSLLSRLI